MLPIHGTLLCVDSERNLKTGVGTISRGHFYGGAHFGILVINYFTSTTGARIDHVSGGNIQGVVALQVDVGCDIGDISGGTIAGQQGMLNAGTIGKISGNAKISGTTYCGIFNYAGGQINEISGGTISTDALSEPGIANAGTIDKVSGGTIIGGWSAISCTGITKGKLNIITGGVFYSKLYTTITLHYPLQLEPGLSATQGLGRYRSGNANIFNDETLVTYPAGYFMSTRTEPVAGIDDVEFIYLTKSDKYPIEYVLNGGINNDNNPSAYDTTNLP